MAEFRYKAKDSKGKVRSGQVTATSKAEAKKAIARMRLKPITIMAAALDGAPGEDEEKMLGGLLRRDDKGQIQINLGEAQPNVKDIVVFTKQFAVMINSGVPLIQALGILAQQQRVPAFGRTLDRIRYTIENGATLSEAMEAYPKIFDHLFVSMVRAGEASGSLDKILLKLVSYIEKSAKIKGQVKSAMFYPAVVLVVAVVVVSGLLIFVVPTFAKQYSDSGKDLPFLTEVVMIASNTLVEQWYLIIGVLGGGLFGLRAYVQTEKGRTWFDAMILKVPGFGQLFRKIAVGRFCTTMATMLSSGVNLLEALSICASSSGNKTIETFIHTVRGSVEQGSRISDPLAVGGLFPQMVVSMVAVGEQTGALDEMLQKVSEFYEDEVDLAVKTLLSMIEPIMIVFIGGIVGFIVIAMYLPIFDMGTTM